MSGKKIVVINLGSLSTKVAYYEDETCICKATLQHPHDEVAAIPTVWDQYDYRRAAILAWLAEEGLDLAGMDAVVSRGGATQPIPGGVYRINETMVQQCRSGLYGTHPTDVGVQLAFDFGKLGPIPLTANTPSTDEFHPLARYSGLPELPRRSSFHALNHKAVGRLYAKEAGRLYEELNLVIVHMGGGVSVAAHCKGRMVDGPNALDGDGPFSTNRAGTLPPGALAELCFSGRYTKQEILRKINGAGGLVAHLGEGDCLKVEQAAAAGDAKSEEVLRAMCYQVAKQVGAMAAVLHGEVDAILFTGGIAYSKLLVGWMSEQVAFIAPIHVYPGEFEMDSLAQNAYLVLTKKAEALEIRAPLQGEGA